MIELLKVSKSFGDTNVLKDFNAEFKDGQINFLTGDSGKGKSTVIRLILGLENPDKGIIKIEDSCKFSVVFQENRLFDKLSIEDNIGYITNNSLKINMIKALGLSEYLGKPVCSLSGGTKRRVSVLRALCGDYDILLMDEPFTGLDENMKKQVMDAVMEYSAGKTVIIATHDKYAIEYMNKGNNIIEVK